jgi:hypothetical protein
MLLFFLNPNLSYVFDRKKKYKKTTEPEILQSMELVVIGEVANYFPAETKVTAQQVFEAVKRFSEKYSRTPDVVDWEIETEKFQNGEEEIACTINHPNSSLKKEKEKPKQKPTATSNIKLAEIAKAADAPKVTSKIVSIASPVIMNAIPLQSNPTKPFTSRPKCLDRVPPVLPHLPPGHEWIPQLSTIFDDP